MYGAIYGDLVGSIYEYQQLDQISSIKTDNLIYDSSFFSDDTILTIAILDALEHDRDYNKYLKEYIQRYKNYKPNFEPYFEHPFSPGLIRWSENNTWGTSKGNGALMRISPIGLLLDSEEEVIKNACLATMPSHKSKEAINAATTLALLIYYLKDGYIKEEAYNKMGIDVNYKPFDKFNTTCGETLDNCLYAFYHSEGMDDAMKKTLAMGGDTDTNCAIVGSLAEAAYGIDDSVKDIVESKIPDEFVKVLKKVR